ncbi:phosphohistidine phosphatase SixA [Idiomarina sp.]|uniref:phosphohistidine phosphatase SixA n=1 Tax=Idiomarina sp. TaxID=1874361 RepID=UPI0025BC08F6|nr:phosphohistidine phosphatase SixA [Idiomarina sp.]MEC7644255.1 phosphohistidine phosphatase SixA [Pseudomonadota bacterium]NQZ03812.1 phosphohistidine phosphatase SixA [Idiomarina sp.]
MKLYIMRHGQAEPMSDPWPDSERRLTDEGITEVRHASEWLIQQCDVVEQCYTSPYQRARETQRVMNERLNCREVKVLDCLTPEKRVHETVTELAAELAIVGVKSALVVTHMPLVSYLVAEIDKTQQPPIFSTAAIAEIDFDPATGTGKLRQLMQPEHC